MQTKPKQVLRAQVKPQSRPDRLQSRARLRLHDKQTMILPLPFGSPLPSDGRGIKGEGTRESRGGRGRGEGRLAAPKSDGGGGEGSRRVSVSPFSLFAPVHLPSQAAV